ncbi:MAG: aminomethyl-transferring glycine dehydrogenase subunit GcvPA [candidate division Zixibacteria bacterium]|nr:aminomethyl-transferring glycine dehydrogenase subunit GcvPA [candidate division Zixibacteria bacterium]
MSYIPNTQTELDQMLKSIGFSSFEDLIKNIPASIRYNHNLNIPKPLSEYELINHLTELSEKNKRYLSVFAGAGAYDHYVPAIINSLISRSEFLTAYTPYQPEAAQGTLQAIYEFQSMVSNLTGLPVTNASMYDGASALAEAILLAARHTGRKETLVAATVNPNYIETVKTYLTGTDIKLITIPFAEGLVDYEFLRNKLSDNTAAFVVQNPNFLGLIENIDEAASDIKNCGALLIESYDPISLGILKSPAELGADIAVAEGQPLGLPLSYGGPYLGLFSVRKELIRKMPGRLVAKTTDANGKTGYVLTLQTREQHIRREKATSNICTNQQLCALASAIYMAVTGKAGIKRTAELCLINAHYAAEKIGELPGFKLQFAAPFFKEFVVQTPIQPKKIIKNLGKYNILAGLDLNSYKIGLKGCLMIAATEKITFKQIDELVFRLSKVK